MNFVTDFLPQIMPLIVMMGVGFVMLFMLQALIRREQKKARAKKKEAVMKDAPTKAQQVPKSEPMLADDPLAELNAAGEYDPADDPLAELNAARDLDIDPGDDPLAELYAARQEAEEDPVQIGELLGVQAQEPVYGLDQEPVAVRLSTGTITQARLILSVLRDKEDKRLMILENDTAYRTLVDAPDMKKRFASLMKELSTVILKPDTQGEDASQEEADELTALLAGMDQSEPHEIAKEDVKVKLFSGGYATGRELLCILRDESDDRLMLLLGNKAYRTLQGAEKMKKGFTSLIKELSTVIHQPDDRPESETSPAPVVAPTPEPSIPESVPADTQQDAAQEDVYDDEEEAIPGVLPDFSIPDNPDNYKVGRFGRVSVKHVDQAPELNIAEAIEAFLQYKIGQTPAFQKRGIHIAPSISGGVRIQADGKTYEFVDEIEDEPTRKFIQEAIAEWQDHH